MIGIIGKKEFAEQVKEDVKLFLENTLKLQLSVEKKNQNYISNRR